ncbi:MAG: ABC transporter ATP-binding protein [Chloroflexi bacterium]|nr:ABC transporter ATP-binding protein [Chloroflexota bacterium]
MSALLEVDGVSSGYGSVTIVRDVSLSLDRGELATIIGPNGAGKSTLLKAIFGLLPVTAGAVRLDGAEVTHASPSRMVGLGVSFVPQTDNVFPSLTIRENLEMGGYRRRGDLEERLGEVISLFPELQHRPGDAASKLSGGQRQALAIGRALMLDPAVLLLDEPTAALSPARRGEIFERLLAVRATGVALLLVEQNAREALAISDRGYLIVDGRKAHEEPGPAMLDNAEVGRMFLGLEEMPDEGGAPFPAGAP